MTLRDTTDWQLVTGRIDVPMLFEDLWSSGPCTMIVPLAQIVATKPGDPHVFIMRTDDPQLGHDILLDQLALHEIETQMPKENDERPI